MELKYKNLVKRLHFRENMGGTPARLNANMEAADLNGIEVNFVIGVYDLLGLWAPKRGYKDTVDRNITPKPLAHAHTFPELLFFYGYGADGLHNLGARINLSLGKEYEQHVISEPALVVAPPNLPHCPVYTEACERPYAHMHIALSADHGLEGATTTVEQEGSTDGSKYSYLVRRFSQAQKPDGAEAGFIFTGQDLEGTPLTVTMGMYNREGSWFPGKGALVNPYHKLLIIFGNNAENPNDLGAEISVCLGEEKEEHILTEASVIVVPPNTPHMPVVCRKIKMPYYALQVEFSARPEGTWL